MDIGFESDRLLQWQVLQKKFLKPQEMNMLLILAIAISSCFYPRSDIREMFGLIIYPAEKPGEYYRIGSFRAEATGKDKGGEGTGLLLAEDWEERKHCYHLG
ncbi:unnamed protein product [Fusarium fujikuroi]|nr:unnamed protein product [Fusarium fujikuroi]VZH91431.1 unnamed protein product [Fusarium fujikuroi]